MNDMNCVFLVGRLTKDAEIRRTATGTSVGSFSLAVNRGVKRGEQWADEVSFFDCSCFGNVAEKLQPYLVKGKQVSVTGYLEQQRWEKDGQRHSKVCVIVSAVQLLGGKEQGGGAPEYPRPQEYRQTDNYRQTAAAPQQRDDLYCDDIPF